MTHDSSYPLSQHRRVSGLQCSHATTATKTPAGYTWRQWVLGNAIPLICFTILSVFGSLLIQKELVSLARDGIHLYTLLGLLRRCLMLGFLLLLVAAYLTRRQAVQPAHGFWERVFPLLVLFAGPTGLSFLERTELPQQWIMVGIGILLTLFGYCISLWALWHLRGSFAIMAEARSPVMSGPYRYIRHPLYLGEQLTMLGLCLMIGTAIALLFWAAFTGLQLTRARIEEAKLAHQFDEYKAYQQRTRFILPGL